MLLIYTQKLSPRIIYVFRHICTRILDIEIAFTSVIEEFISHNGPKLSYGKQPLGNELFIQSIGLLSEQGVESVSIQVKDWGETKCFFGVSNRSALSFDIFSASFYLLSRYEEYLPHLKDSKGRYPSSESLGFKEGFLEQPVIDIWAYKFKDLLSEVFPNLVFPKKELAIHSVVLANEPYAYIQKGFFRSFIGYIGDFGKFRIRSVIRRSKVLLGIKKDPYDTFNWIINVNQKSERKLSVFFLLGEALTFKAGLNTRRLKFKLLVKMVADYAEVGLMFSSHSLKYYDELKAEKKRFEEITHRTLLNSTNANNLVSLPDIYRSLVELEIERDFTMTFEDSIGFRAGTCTPFLFYDLDYEVRTPLVIHPVAAMTTAFEGKFASDINKTVLRIMNSVEKVNGTFTMVFSNTDFTQEEGNKIWRSIFTDKLN